MGTRIRDVRKALGLSQEAFAARLCVSRGVIVNAELERFSTNDSLVKLICVTYNVSESWLRTGDGDMFVVTDTAALDAVCQRYEVDAAGRALLEAYLELPEDYRRGVVEYARLLAGKLAPSGAADEAEVIATGEALRQTVVKKIAASRAQEAAPVLGHDDDT